MRKLFFILLITTFYFLTAQKFDYDYDYGQKFKKSHTYVNTIFGSDTEGYVGLKKPIYTFSQKHYLESYTADFTPKEKELLAMKVNGDHLKVWKAILLGEKIFVFYWRKEPLTSSMHLFAHEYDKKTLKPIGSLRELIVIENHEFFGDEFGIDFNFSKDSSTIVLAGVKYDNELKVLENKFIVYSYSFKKLYEKIIYVDSVMEIEQHEDVIVTNKGEIYSVMNIKELGKTTYTTKIFKITQFNETVTYDISEKDIYPQSMKLYDNDDENVFCVGIYKNDSLSYSSQGTIFVQIDHLNDEIIKDLKLPFDYSKIVGIKSMDTTSNKILEEQLVIKDFVKLDGQFVLMLEERGETLPLGESVGMTEIAFNYNNIIMFAYSESGNLNWMQIVNKKQSYPPLGEACPASFKSFIHKDKLQFVTTEANEKSHGINIYTVEPNGSMSISHLEKIEGERFITRPFSVVYQGSQVLVPIQIGEKHLRILRVLLD